MRNFNQGNNSCRKSCMDKFGCPPGQCPDFVIRRHDTKPDLRILVEDCDGPLDLRDENLILEVNMWANASFQKDVKYLDTYFRLSDDVGFEQIMIGDVIVVSRVRSVEKMLVIGFDETNKLVEVQRGYDSSMPSDWKKGTKIRMFRILNGTAAIESQTEDIEQLDGSTLTDQLIATYFVYQWQPNDTCMPGCFWLEFKLLQMTPDDIGGLSLVSEDDQITYQSLTGGCSSCGSNASSVTPSFISVADNCDIGAGVEWVRRFPTSGEGFLIKIEDSPNTET